MTEAEETIELINRVVCEPVSWELLHFLAWHPRTHFGGQALVQLLSPESSSRVKEGLNRLVASGLVRTLAKDGVATYWLTQSEPAHNLVKKKFNSDNLTLCSVKPV